MSMENVKTFYEMVKGDRSLQQEIAKSVNGDSTKAEATVIKLAGEKGYTFSKEELKAFFSELAKTKQSGELNDSQLEAVAGGKGDPVTFDSVMALGINC